MNAYIINASFILGVCLVFYKLFLEKETFFPANRYLLLFFLVLSFGLPLVPISEGLSIRSTLLSSPIVLTDAVSPSVNSIGIANSINQMTPISIPSSNLGEANPISFWQVLVWVYWAGAAIFFINFVIQFIVLVRKSYGKNVIIDGKFKIVELSGDQAPCSFGNCIFINPEKYDWDTYSQIILHEKVHIEQKHSYDIIVAELALIFQWFNPFAWMYRRTLEDNLEYLTDNELLDKKNVDQDSYQLNLVKVSAPHFPLSLTSNYNQSTLKKRLKMMNAKKSNFNTVWKYFCIVPVSFLLVSLLNEPMAQANTKALNFVSNQNIAGNWFGYVNGQQCSIKFIRGESLEQTIFHKFKISEFDNFKISKSSAFKLERAAGVIQFKGDFDGGEGQGKFNLSVNSGFKNQLEKRGIQNVNDQNYLMLFMLQPELKFIDSLSAIGFSKINLDDLNAISALGISAKYIASLKAAGMQELSLKQIIALKAMNITPEFIAHTRQNFNGEVSTENVIAMKAITSNNELNDKTRSQDLYFPSFGDTKGPKVSKGPKGYKGPKDFNSEAFEKDMEEWAMGIASGALSMVGNGLSLAANSLSQVELDKIQQKVTATFTPTKEFLKSFEDIGFELSEEAGVNLYNLKIEAKTVKPYTAMGFKNLVLDTIINAIFFQVTPEFIKSERKKGYNSNQLDYYIERKLDQIAP